jgi:hypothetical protein
VVVLKKAGLWRVTAKYQGLVMVSAGYSITVLPQAVGNPQRSTLQGEQLPVYV